MSGFNRNLFEKGDRVKVIDPGGSAEVYRDMEGRVTGLLGQGASWVKLDSCQLVLFWNEELQRVG